MQFQVLRRMIEPSIQNSARRAIDHIYEGNLAGEIKRGGKKRKSYLDVRDLSNRQTLTPFSTMSVMIARPCADNSVN